VVPELVACLDHPALALGQWLYELSVLHHRLCDTMHARMHTCVSAWHFPCIILQG
jgi:hypothetical protein